MKIKVIINTKVRDYSRERLTRLIGDCLSSHQLDFSPTAYRGHATWLARSAAAAGYDTIVAVGGDGTVNEVINGAAGRDVTIGIMPLGTANDLAAFFGIPRNIHRACEIIQRRTTQETDLLCVNGSLYATSGGIGLPCEVVDFANAIRSHGRTGRLLRRLLGRKIYVLATLLAVSRKKRHHNRVTIYHDGLRYGIDALTVMADNLPFLGGRFRMSPGADPSDGVADLCLIKNSKSRLEVLSLLSRVMRGTHEGLPYVSLRRAGQLTIDCDNLQAFFGDGEILQEARRFEVRVLPGALKLIVPAKDGG